jgi:hypothetical protein
MNIYSNFIHGCQNWEASNMSFGSDDSINQIYPENGILFSIKKK